MPLVDFFKEIPGLTEAVKRENDWRDAAFADPITDCCGVRLRQMTAQDLLILDGLDNALVQGRIPSSQQLAFFLWQLAMPSERRWGIYWFTRRVRRIEYAALVARCDTYLDATFQDSPKGGSARQRPIASWLAHLVDRLASEYGWSEEYILSLPLRRAFQYQKAMAWRRDPDFIPYNPSDRLVSPWLVMRQPKVEKN